MASVDVHQLQFERVLAPTLRSGGQVELYFNPSSEKYVAVKRLPRERLCRGPLEFSTSFPNELENPWTEIEITQCLGCAGPEKMRGVNQCLGAFRDQRGDALIISEYLPDGDLFSFASAMGTPGPARERQVWPLLHSLFNTVLDLHDRGVAHCDLSLENILLRPGLGQELVLIDFGMAVAGNLSSVQGVRGKASYQAPEMHKGKNYDARSSDLFSLGVIAYCLAIGNYPWQSTRPKGCRAFTCFCRDGPDAFFEQKRIGRGRKAKQCLSSKFTKLLSVLLDTDPTRRHGAAAIFNSQTVDAIPQAAMGG